MSPSLNGSGVVYPTIELGGITYVVKLTRGGVRYRLSKNGVNFSDFAKGPRQFAALIDSLHAMIADQYSGTPADLAELVTAEDKLAEVDSVVAEAIKKAYPPTQPLAIREPAETSTDQKPPVQ